jgi:hypothetical protein
LALASFFFLYGDANAQTAATDLQDFLRARAGFTDADFAVLKTGRSVAKIIQATDRREVAAVGVVRVLPRPDLFMRQYRAELTRPGRTLLQGGVFGEQPAPEELQTLTLEPRDIEDIKGCEAGKCRVKLSAEMIERLRREVDWAAPDYQAQATNLFRRMLLDYVRAYARQGDAALITYRDQKEEVSLAAELRSLITDTSFLGEYAPEFAQELADYPRGRLPAAESFIYWAKLKYQLKPVVTVTHVTVYKAQRGGASLTLIASKQLYADHYFDSSFGLTAFVTLPTPAGQDAYLLYMNRSRADVFNGAKGRLLRPLIELEAVGAINKNLDATKQRMAVAAINESDPEAAETADAGDGHDPPLLLYSGLFIFCAGLATLLGFLFARQYGKH